MLVGCDAVPEIELDPTQSTSRIILHAHENLRLKRIRARSHSGVADRTLEPIGVAPYQITRVPEHELVILDFPEVCSFLS